MRVQGEKLGPDLDQISAGTEAAQRHSRVSARDQHQLRPRWNLVDEKRENRPALLGRYDVHVVQHQDERVTVPELAGQHRQDDLIDPGPRSRQLLQQFTVNRARAPERRRDPGQQHHRVVVAVAGLHPVAGPRIRLTPLRDKRRLPVTRRRRDQHQPAALRDHLQRSETSSRHDARPDSRTSKLRVPQQRPGLGQDAATHRSQRCRRQTCVRASPRLLEGGTAPTSLTNRSTYAPQIRSRNAQHTRSAASGDATSRCPTKDDPDATRALNGAISAKNTKKPSGKPQHRGASYEFGRGGAHECLRPRQAPAFVAGARAASS